MNKLIAFSILSVLLAACATSPTDRRQVVFYSEEQMAQQGEAAYRQMQDQIPITENRNQTNYVQCVADYIIEALSDEQRNANVWEVTVFDNEQANAFALPGGKIGVYNGLLDVAVTQHQLAAVMAHEVGHVIANHSNERASQSTIRTVGVTAARIFGVSDTAIEAIDYGTQIGLFLPFNRTQESEADVVGLMLMAEAGFDPQQSITLWENMNAVGGQRPPEFLSTHPAPETRMSRLNEMMSAAQTLRRQAQSQGLNPDCVYLRR
ncbi:MAG: M48 family metallopeptidase [Gammaproteobacteria bacterium]